MSGWDEPRAGVAFPVERQTDERYPGTDHYEAPSDEPKPLRFASLSLGVREAVTSPSE